MATDLITRDDDPGDDRESPAKSETGRLEAFSDCVLAVIITIMAFDLRPPTGGSFAGLRDRVPALLIYILSFAFIAIYWNNHHHLLRAARQVTAGSCGRTCTCCSGCLSSPF